MWSRLGYWGSRVITRWQKERWWALKVCLIVINKYRSSSGLSELWQNINNIWTTSTPTENYEKFNALLLHSDETWNIICFLFKMFELDLQGTYSVPDPFRKSLASFRFCEQNTCFPFSFHLRDMCPYIKPRSWKATVPSWYREDDHHTQTLMSENGYPLEKMNAGTCGAWHGGKLLHFVASNGSNQSLKWTLPDGWMKLYLTSLFDISILEPFICATCTK